MADIERPLLELPPRATPDLLATYRQIHADLFEQSMAAADHELMGAAMVDPEVAKKLVDSFRYIEAEAAQADINPEELLAIRNENFNIHEEVFTAE